MEGIFRDGKVELLETPDDVDEARVIVTFLPEGSVNLSERGIDEAPATAGSAEGDDPVGGPLAPRIRAVGGFSGRAEHGSPGKSTAVESPEALP